MFAYPKAIRRVISKRAADSVRNAMVQVTQKGGTGTKAQVEGFRVAGKTGTASKLNPETKRYYRTKNVVSFAGFLPADDPKLAMIVIVDDPKASWAERYGGAVAAPLFSEIAARSMAVLGVERPRVLVGVPERQPAAAAPAVTTRPGRITDQPRLIPLTATP